MINNKKKIIKNESYNWKGSQLNETCTLSITIEEGCVFII